MYLTFIKLAVFLKNDSLSSHSWISNCFLRMIRTCNYLGVHLIPYFCQNTWYVLIQQLKRQLLLEIGNRLINKPIVTPRRIYHKTYLDYVTRINIICKFYKSLILAFYALTVIELNITHPITFLNVDNAKTIAVRSSLIPTL